MISLINPDLWIIFPAVKLHEILGFSTATLDRSNRHRPFRDGTPGACVLRRVAGWVGIGGCWDDDITNVMTGIIPENSLSEVYLQLIYPFKVLIFPSFLYPLVN